MGQRKQFPCSGATLVAGRFQNQFLVVWDTATKQFGPIPINIGPPPAPIQNKLSAFGGEVETTPFGFTLSVDLAGQNEAWEWFTRLPMVWGGKAAISNAQVQASMRLHELTSVPENELAGMVTIAVGPHSLAATGLPASFTACFVTQPLGDSWQKICDSAAASPHVMRIVDSEAIAAGKTADGVSIAPITTVLAFY